MKSVYRFYQVKDGRCYFALVELNVSVGGNSLTITDALSDQVTRGEGEVNGSSHPDWVRAALNGIKDTLEEARRNGALAAGCEVELRRLVGTDVDTSADVVRCAAALATVAGIPESPLRVDAVLAKGEWGLVFTTPLHGARQDQLPLRWTFRAKVQSQSAHPLGN